jgi:GGDEF domain-containing protein
MVMPTAHTAEPAYVTPSPLEDRFATIRSLILAARRSPDFHRALRLTAAAVRQLHEHPGAPERIDATWFDQWLTTIGDLGDLVDHGLLPACEHVTDTDPLTGLGNRRALDRRLADSVGARSGP